MEDERKALDPWNLDVHYDMPFQTFSATWADVQSALEVSSQRWNLITSVNLLRTQLFSINITDSPNLPRDILKQLFLMLFISLNFSSIDNLKTIRKSVGLHDYYLRLCSQLGSTIIAIAGKWNFTMDTLMGVMDESFSTLKGKKLAFCDGKFHSIECVCGIFLAHYMAVLEATNPSISSIFNDDLTAFSQLAMRQIERCIQKSSQTTIDNNTSSNTINNNTASAAPKANGPKAVIYCNRCNGKVAIDHAVKLCKPWGGCK